MTKLRYYKLKTNIPAGILEGTEAFWFDNEKWLIHNGEAMKFKDAPIKLRNMIVYLFKCDVQSRAYLTKIGVKAFSESFEMWYKCVIGGIDETPDFGCGRLQPDAFNNNCKDYDCPHRGRFCSLAIGLKYFEVSTIAALKAGFTETQTAQMLCVSEAGLKSRIEKIKEKLGATNMASMIARGVELGI